VFEEKLAFVQTLPAYDRWAASYDHIENPLVAATSWVLDQRPLACCDTEVIELGCGTGRNAPRVLEEGARSYTGVDGSQGMLEVARGSSTDPRVTWLDADLRSWTPPRRFGLAFVVLVLEHLLELSTFVETLAAAVEVGGRLRIVDLHPDRIAAGSVAHFHDGERDVVFPSVAHQSRRYAVPWSELASRSRSANGSPMTR
jgi:trans-aconitate methyltransferase